VPSCAYARKSDATRSWCTQLAAPAPPDVARRLSGGPPQVTAKSMISPGFCGQNMPKFRSVWGTPKRGCQGLNMTSIWGLAFEFGCRCEPWELQVSSGKRTSMACSKMNLLIIVYCQLDAFLINSHSQTRSISLAIKSRNCPWLNPSVCSGQTLSNTTGRLCHGWTLLVHRLRSPTVLQGQH